MCCLVRLVQCIFQRIVQFLKLSEGVHSISTAGFGESSDVCGLETVMRADRVQGELAKASPSPPAHQPARRTACAPTGSWAPVRPSAGKTGVPAQASPTTGTAPATGFTADGSNVWTRPGTAETSVVAALLRSTFIGQRHRPRPSPRHARTRRTTGRAFTNARGWSTLAVAANCKRRWRKEMGSTGIQGSSARGTTRDD